jgi:hypothetical protein
MNVKKRLIVAIQMPHAPIILAHTLASVMQDGEALKVTVK